MTRSEQSGLQVMRYVHKDNNRAKDLPLEGSQLMARQISDW